MSSITSPSVRPEIASLLGRLRTKIQTYLFAHGLSLVVVVACGAFFATLAFDWLHFQLRKLELPIGFRIFLLLAAFGLLLWVIGSQILTRMLRSKQSRSLALILERRFPALNDRLITAVELGNHGAGRTHTPLSEGMLQNTIAGVVKSTGELNLSDVFDWRPLIRSALLGLFLVAAVGLTAVGAPAAFDRWQRAFIHLDEIYWNRETSLDVVVLAAPNDRERQFRDGVYKHPSGADLRLLVRVPETGRGADGKQSWVIPETVDIEYRLSSAGGTELKPLARRGDREFQFKLSGLHDSMEFWLHGNDFVNRTPLKIQIVDPPFPERIVARCDYAPYTQLNQESLDERAITNKHLELPDETMFVLDVGTNKPLRNVTVQAGPYEFLLGDFSGDESDKVDPASLKYSVRRMNAPEGDAAPVTSIPAEVGSKLFEAGGSTLRIPFVMSRRTVEELAGRKHRLPAELGTPWLLSELTEFKIYLQDLDGIVSAEPVKFTIGSKIDEPPVVECRPRGIGTAITRQASIPMTGMITDDYGIAVATFEFKVDADEQFRTRGFRNPPGGAPLEFRLQRSEEEAAERFEVLPLDLKVGQKLTLTVYARDGDDINGPHEARSESQTYEIVTREELLGILYEREINLRRQFEQIIVEVERTKADLQTHFSLSEELDRLRTSGAAAANAQTQIDNGAIALSNCAERSLHQIGKNRAETAAILETFQAVLEELVNNGVHTRQMNERIDGLVIKPLKAITDIDFPHADESVGLFRQANQTGDDPKPRISQSIDALDEMLLHMKQVLAEISDLAEFHEALKDLKKMIEDQEGIRKQTEEERKNSLKDKLKGLGLE